MQRDALRLQPRQNSEHRAIRATIQLAAHLPKTPLNAITPHISALKTGMRKEGNCGHSYGKGRATHGGTERSTMTASTPARGAPPRRMALLGGAALPQACPEQEAKQGTRSSSSSRMKYSSGNNQALITGLQPACEREGGGAGGQQGTRWIFIPSSSLCYQYPGISIVQNGCLDGCQQQQQNQSICWHSL